MSVTKFDFFWENQRTCRFERKNNVVKIVCTNFRLAEIRFLGKSVTTIVEKVVNTGGEFVICMYVIPNFIITLLLLVDGSRMSSRQIQFIK